jgi:hypothetical protein
MQDDLRRPDQDSFPMAEFFRGNRSNMIPSALAARISDCVRTLTPEPQFTSGTPDIYDAQFQRQWLLPGTEFPYPAP